VTPPALDSGRGPFEQFFLGLGLVAGLPLLFGAPPPRSVAQLLSPTLVHVWAAFLVFGCITALVGVWWVRRLDVEQLGLVSVGVGSLIYGIGLITSGLPGSGVAVGYVLAYGAACFWRALQIQRAERLARRNLDIHD
jgi:hypothetical protein